MNEFKGTKSPWKLANNDFGYYTSVRNIDDTRKVAVSHVNNQEESNANMVLISFAPEMLEMLEKTVCHLKEIQNMYGFKNHINQRVVRIQQLIKKATTI